MLNVSVCVGVCMFVCRIIFQIKYDVKGVCECASVVFRHDKTSSYDDVNLWLVTAKVFDRFRPVAAAAVMKRSTSALTSFKCPKLDPSHESNEFWEIVWNSCVCVYGGVPSTLPTQLKRLLLTIDTLTQLLHILLLYAHLTLLLLAKRPYIIIGRAYSA